MNTPKPFESSNGPVNQAPASNSMQAMRELATPTPSQHSEPLATLAQRSMDALRDGSQHLRERALHASDATRGYVKDEPVKSMLMAAAAGATLMALLGLVLNSRRR